MRYERIPSCSDWLRDSASVGTHGRIKALQTAFLQGGTGSVATTRPTDLAPIDKHLEDYWKTWSPMAKRNMVVDLIREIDKWGSAHPGRLPVPLEALKDVAQRTVRELGLSGAYSQVICTGWAIGCNYRASTGLVSRNTTKNPDYFKHSANDLTDMTQKCAEMVKAVKAAQTAISLNGLVNNDRTLKVFMAPEFIFRGENGAYSPEIVSQILPKLRRDLGPGWNDWLFVFGTAVASIEIELTYCETCLNANRSYNITRTVGLTGKTTPKCDQEPGSGPAHVIKLGSVAAEVQNVALISYRDDTHLVAKEYVSGIDYKNNQVRVQPGTPEQKDLRAAAPNGSRQRGGSLFDDERMGGCIMNIAGLTVGLEVCLDHIASSTPNMGRASSYAGAIQLLLIPSYGMEIGTGLYCKTGGVVFNVDGRGHGRSHLAINNGGAASTKVKMAVPSGRGSVEVWTPIPLPA